jgi:D-alanyl-D-alanine carboxypeptidase
MFTLLRRAPTVALVLTFVLAAFSPALAPQTALASTAPLPTCTYSNVMTPYTLPSEWRITLVDTALRVGRHYVPRGLVSTAEAGLAAKQYVRKLVIPDLTALAQAAAANGTPLRVVSAYRSYRAQQKLYRYEVSQLGVDAARLLAARPGHSEHQLGTAIDFGSANLSEYNGVGSDWAKTPTGAWMEQNAWRYGFVMSYPSGDTAVTCYQYEPWHYRYVGRPEAAAVHASGLTLREYLWENYDE